MLRLRVWCCTAFRTIQIRQVLLYKVELRVTHGTPPECIDERRPFLLTLALRCSAGSRDSEIAPSEFGPNARKPRPYR